MDLSSSATQRSHPSEALSIQPGSVRAATAEAANEFARHLAENTRTDAPRHRDDRPAERAERADKGPEHTREARDRKAEARENNSKTAVNSAITTEPGDALAIVAEAENSTEAEATPDSTAIGIETDTANTETPEGEIAVGTEEIPFATAPETPAGTDIEASDKNGEGVAPSNMTTARDDDTAQHEINPQALQAAPIAPQISATDAAAINAQANMQAAGGENNAQSTVPNPADGLPNQGDAEAEAPEAPLANTAKPAKPAKPAKGLGQEAAEQLADKKTDAKPSADGAKAAQSQVTAPPPVQAAAAPQTFFMTALENSTAPRSGDPLTGPVPASSSATGAAGTIRIGTLPGQSQPTQVPAAAIALQMARNLQKGISRFEIRLDPPEMGRIDVRMEIRKDGHVVAHMSVERPETLDLLQRDARALQQALNNAGLQADNDSLNFSLKDQSGDTSGQHLAGGETSNHGMGAEEDEAPALPIYNVNLAMNGGVDIRI